MRETAWTGWIKRKCVVKNVVVIHITVAAVPVVIALMLVSFAFSSLA